MTLFRHQALAARHTARLGTILLDRSPLWTLAAGLVLAGVAGLAVLVWRGEYTRRARLQGYVVPQAGLVRVASPAAGRVAAVHVREGDAVAQGDRLLTLVDERMRGGGDDARLSVLRQIEARKRSILAGMVQQRALHAAAAQGMRTRLAGLRQEEAQLSAELHNQGERLALAQGGAARYGELAGLGFVSAAVSQEKSELVLEQRARVQAVERALVALRREAAGLQADLAALPLREAAELAGLERALAVAEQEAIEVDSSREHTLVAPARGRVSALAVQGGYQALAGRTLLTIVPATATGSTALEAQLFAASRDIGFVRPGQQVLVRYEAFSYQKFGHHRGTVHEVSRTPVEEQELPAPVGTPAGGSLAAAADRGAAAGREPLFRVRVRLERESIRAYGEQQALQPGMRLEADVMLDTRTLFEWIFEPLYSLHGKYGR